MNNIVKAYSNALFELCVEKQCLEHVYQDITIMDEIIDDAYLMLYIQPNITKNTKKQMMQEVFKNVNPLLLNFVQILIDKNKIKYLKAMFNEFIMLYNNYHGIVEIVIRTAKQLSEQQIERIKTAFEKKYEKRIKPKVIIDEKLIAGISIRIQDETFDYSIANQLTQLRNG